MRSSLLLRAAVGIAALLWGAIAIREARATELRQLSLDEITTSSSEVVAGRVVAVRTEWTDRKVYSVASLQTELSAKGQLGVGQTVEVWTPGGAVRKPIPVKMHVPGAATFTVGEEVVVFLKAEKQGKGRRFVVGLGQGKLLVTRDPHSGEKRVRFGLPVKGARMVDKDGRPLRLAEEGKDPPKGESVEGFLGRVQQVVRNQTSGIQKDKEGRRP